MVLKIKNMDFNFRNNHVKSDLKLTKHDTTKNKKFKKKTSKIPKKMNNKHKNISKNPIKKPNKKPVANSGGPYYCIIGEEIWFNASESYDSDGYIVKFTWYLDDEITDFGEVTNYTYSEPGEYFVILKVQDNDGATKTNFTTAYVIDRGDGTVDSSDFLLPGVFFKGSHKWIKPGEYVIKIIANDDEEITEIELTITIDENLPEESNLALLLLLIILLILLLWAYLTKRKEDEEEEKNNQHK